MKKILPIALALLVFVSGAPTRAQAPAAAGAKAPVEKKRVLAWAEGREGWPDGDGNANLFGF